MELSNTAVFVLIIVIIMFFFMSMANFIIPFKLKSDFDDICSSYHNVVQTKGGITDDIKSRLEKELEDFGFTDIVVTCPSVNEIRYGESFEFKVGCKVTVREPSKFLTFESKQQSLQYKRVSFSKKLVN